MASAPATELESPYKGLAPYTEADFEWFFGRDSQARIVATNLMSTRITILYGGSGIGKTSLLRAGVLPLLHSEAERDIHATGRVDFAVALHNRWQSDPIASLRETVERSVADVCTSEGRRTPHVTTEHLDLALADYAQVIEADILLILDQFEEWFLYRQRTTNGDSAGDELIRTMAAVDLPVHYLISLREDAVAQLDWFKGRVPGVFDNLLRLRPLDRPAARRAIQGPLERFNQIHSQHVEIEETVVERILADVRTGAVVIGQQGQGTIEGNGAAQPDERIEAPFLQLVMTRLWDEERRAHSDTMQLETLEALGGADRIVRTYLDESMDGLDAHDQALAADIFNHLVTPSGSKIAHSKTDLAEYTGASVIRLENLLDRLSRMRILRPVAPMPGPDRTARYEIFHDVLAASILDWRARFLGVQTQRRIATAQARRFWRAAAILLAVILALAAVSAVLFVQRQSADSARNRARASSLAAQALTTQSFIPARAVQQALQAVRLWPSPTTEAALRTVVPPFLAATAVFPRAPVRRLDKLCPGRSARNFCATRRHPHRSLAGSTCGRSSRTRGSGRRSDT